jgi:uncharacterized phage infection (PIP) family protein YhgE
MQADDNGQEMDNMDQQEDEFAQLMNQRLQNISSSEKSGGASDDRLKEMNKKLPDWSLEPPYTYLK